MQTKIIRIHAPRRNPRHPVVGLQPAGAGVPDDKPMSAASDLIERLESETGQRWDVNDGDNATMAGLVGAMARMMWKSDHRERDDVVAGALIQQQMSPEGQRERESREMLCNFLVAGLSPDDIKSFMG